jgi:hypothetical protein
MPTVAASGLPGYESISLSGMAKWGKAIKDARIRE